MALLLKKLYLSYNKFVEDGDPQAAQFTMVRSPVPVVIILTSYMLFVLKYAPKMMEKREPFKLDKTIQFYNVLQICVNFFSLLWGLTRYPASASIFCIPLGDEGLKTCHYVYLWLKLFDLFDTVFFALRKKYNQISFLHVFHHVTMVAFAWVTCKFFPGGHPYFLGILNTAVHVVMYFYYFLTSWNPVYKNSIWWKRHLTELQIAHQSVILFLFVLALLNQNCNYPKFLLVLGVLLNGFIIYLFGKFYVQAYIQKKPSDKK